MIGQLCEVEKGARVWSYLSLLITLLSTISVTFNVKVSATMNPPLSPSLGAVASHCDGRPLIHLQTWPFKATIKAFASRRSLTIQCMN